MRKLLLMASISLFLCACSVEKTYTINGTLPNDLSNGKKAYLYDYGSQSTIDSCVVNDGKFSFTGNSNDSLPILRIELSDHQYYANILMDKGTINVDMNSRSQVYGTPLNDLFAMYTFSLDSVKQLYSQQLDSSNNQIEVNAIIDSYTASKEEITKKYRTGNEQNPLGLFIAWDIIGGITNKEQTVALIDSYINSGGEIFKRFKPILNIKESAINREKTAVGKMFTDVDAFALDDSATKLSDFVGKGKYVLLDFWASWCGPCKDEMVTIKEVYNNYKDRGLVVLGFNVWDTKENFKKSVEEFGITWSQIYELNENATQSYGINNIPHIILFAPDGTIAARGLRGDTMKAKIANIFADKK